MGTKHESNQKNKGGKQTESDHSALYHYQLYSVHMLNTMKFDLWQQATPLSIYTHKIIKENCSMWM